MSPQEGIVWAQTSTRARFDSLVFTYYTLVFNAKRYTHHCLSLRIEEVLSYFLYVDDIIIFGSSDEFISDIICLAKEFAMKDLGPLHFFWELKYIISKAVSIRVEGSIFNVIVKTNMALTKLVGTPLAQKHGLQLATGNTADASLYKSVVGSLQYLCLTRPDISHAVNLVSQFMQAPNTEHFQAVKRILRYVRGTSNYGLRLLARSPLRLYGFSDARLGRLCNNKEVNHSYSIYLGANCISWASRKQRTLSRSDL
ncbi:uncharacterized mitochondrial protein AtMg00810-like [Lycium ferocissimum]|uniref:uncharacterized mitochondrial protein AtMg00810-like n=1 Tax=Lycium ferocissimum TaxID=112874 RepID=UPI002815CE4A|nr:uncharacterized mitochondrial protein AtMg00810-like [Lycium ferocissimum]